MTSEFSTLERLPALTATRPLPMEGASFFCDIRGNIWESSVLQMKTVSPSNKGGVRMTSQLI